MLIRHSYFLYGFIYSYASFFFCYQHFFISFYTQHHDITSTQNKQNKTTDIY